MASTFDTWLEGQQDASRPADPLDLVTWPQYRAAFKIAAMALFEVTQARELSSAQQTASDALAALSAEVRRFDETEPSWEPHGSEG